MHHAAKIVEMDEPGFWEIIKQTSSEHSDPNVAQALRCKNLHNILSAMPIEKIAAFDRRFVMLLVDSYAQYLWDAIGYLKGASDDSFEYFRYWLISRGRDDFYSACGNPDKFLANFVETSECLFLEDFKGTVNLLLLDFESDYLDDLIPYGDPSTERLPDNATHLNLPERFPLITQALAKYKPGNQQSTDIVA